MSFIKAPNRLFGLFIYLYLPSTTSNKPYFSDLCNNSPIKSGHEGGHPQDEASLLLRQHPHSPAAGGGRTLLRHPAAAGGQDGNVHPCISSRHILQPASVCRHNHHHAEGCRRGSCHLSINLSIYPSIYLSIYQSNYL